MTAGWVSILELFIEGGTDTLYIQYTYNDYDGVNRTFYKTSTS
jgi:hypothetical protein